jgi:hypothetical protein
MIESSHTYLIYVEDVPLPVPAACCIRNERKICGLEEYVGWFESSGAAAIKRPSHCEGAVDGDVFIHRYGGEQCQSWIRTKNQTWDVVSRGYKHPYLTGYRLVLGKKPGWVTRKTINTYNYRNTAGSV